jgi:hypothetical protein
VSGGTLAARGASWIHDHREVAPTEAIGGKARNLVGLAAGGILVPPWVVVGAGAFDALAGRGVRIAPQGAA